VGSSTEEYQKRNIHEISANLAFLLHNTIPVLQKNNYCKTERHSRLKTEIL